MFRKKVLYLDEIELFFKKAEQNLKSSKLLYEEGDYSNSVTLSYYAMLLVSKGLLVKKGITPRKHFGIITEFGKIYVHKGDFNLNIYRYLTTSQSLRDKSSYDAIDDITPIIAKQNINNAQEYIQEGKKFL